MAIPTRRRGLVRKRYGPKALVDENCRTVTNNNNNNTARASALAPPDNEAGLVYQGDFFGPKQSDWLRLVSLNLDNLAIKINEPKEVSLFQSILEYRIDILLLQELGLHWSNLSRTKQWRSRVERFLNPKCTWTRCSHNVHDTTALGSKLEARASCLTTRSVTSPWALEAIKPSWGGGPGHVSAAKEGWSFGW